MNEAQENMTILSNVVEDIVFIISSWFSLDYFNPNRAFSEASQHEWDCVYVVTEEKERWRVIIEYMACLQYIFTPHNAYAGRKLVLRFEEEKNGITDVLFVLLWWAKIVSFKKL